LKKEIPDSNPILTPILTRENQTCFGKFIEYKGVKTSYLGAFTRNSPLLCENCGCVVPITAYALFRKFDSGTVDKARKLFNFT